MDALEFLRERKRMCNLCKHCEGCPLERAGCGLGTSASDEEYEKIIAAVEQWSKEHPRKTRQSVFLKQYPNAVLDKDGVLRICPPFVGGDIPEKYKCICLTDCSACRREFWTQEVE